MKCHYCGKPINERTALMWFVYHTCQNCFNKFSKGKNKVCQFRSCQEKAVATINTQRYCKKHYRVMLKEEKIK